MPALCTVSYPCTRVCLQSIAACSRLQYLDVSFSAGVDDGALISVAQQCSRLEVLIVSGCHQVSCESISVVAQCCTVLREIGVSACSSISSDAIRVLEACQVLEPFKVSGCWR